MEPDPEQAMSEALSHLRVALRDLRSGTPRFLVDPLNELAPLVRAVEELGEPAAERPAKATEEHRRQWEAYLAGKRPLIEAGTLRRLCWAPDVATHPAFTDYLRRHNVLVGARGLRGLVWSCHHRWTPDLFQARGAASEVLRRLEATPAVGPTLSEWQERKYCVVSADGPQVFALELLRSRSDVRGQAQRWRVDERSAFVQVGVGRAADLHEHFTEQLVRGFDGRIGFLLARRPRGWIHRFL